MSRITRRGFLKGSVAAAGASVFLSGTKSSGMILGANDRFRIAVCGLHGRGNSHIGGYIGQENVEIAYLVDPDKHVLDRALSGVVRRLKDLTVAQMRKRGEKVPAVPGDPKKKQKPRILYDQIKPLYQVRAVTDVRKVLDDKTIDAISVATPNHWHSLMAIWAAQARKHCYVEKPASHDIYQGRVAAEAFKKYGVIIQHGTQQRSSSGRARMIKAIHEGKFGKLKISYGYCCKPRGSIGTKPEQDPPDFLDWNLWRGPATVERYHANYVHYNWHWFWKTGNGDLNNQGTHQLDVAQWALNPTLRHPIRAMAIGGRFLWNDQGETPNTMFGICEYPGGQYVFFNVRNVNYKGYKRQVMNEFYFADGGFMDDRGRYTPPKGKKPEKIEMPDADITPGGPFGSFVAACRAGDQKMINGNMLEAHYSCVVGHLMNNSYRLGEKVPFNAKAGRFGDNKDAYEHFMKLHEIMRDGCGVPEDKAHYIVGPWLTFDPKTERFVGDRAEEANRLLRDPNRKGFEIPDVEKV